LIADHFVVKIFVTLRAIWAISDAALLAVLRAMKGALEAYGDSHNLRKIERALFKRVADRFCSCDAVETVQATSWPPQVQVMDDRGGAAPTVHVPLVPDSPTRSVRSYESPPQNPQDDEPPPKNPQYHEEVEAHAIAYTY
jgi:hypothetical protein